VSRTAATLKMLLERSEEHCRLLKKENSDLREVILDLTLYIESQKKINR
jgi:hypothetical protein